MFILIKLPYKKPNKEDNMLEVTEKASEMIKDFLKDREEIPAIRIMLSQGG
jgi:Fe-S cluster assembly iron-binding protein IscA